MVRLVIRRPHLFLVEVDEPICHLLIIGRNILRGEPPDYTHTTHTHIQKLTNFCKRYSVYTQTIEFASNCNSQSECEALHNIIVDKCQDKI